MFCFQFGQQERALRRRATQTLFSLSLSVISLNASAQEGSAPSGPPVNSEPSAETARTAQGTLPGEEPNPPSPRRGDLAELNRIVELYMAGGYERCSAELRALLDKNAHQSFQDPNVIERGRLYFASCSLLEGNHEEARAALRAALQQNPLMRSPDSLTFPPPVVSLFLEVRDEVQQLIADREKEQVLQLRRDNERARREAERRESRERQLEQLATQEVVIAKNSRLVASIPFGVGQFQNGSNSLGTVVLVSEGLLLATAFTSAMILESLTTKQKNKPEKIVPESHNRQQDAAYATMTWSSWALLGTCVLGILEAQLNFRPERRLELRHRPLPADLQSDGGTGAVGFELRPTFSFEPQGGRIGVAGAF